MRKTGTLWGCCDKVDEYEIGPSLFIGNLSHPYMRNRPYRVGHVDLHPLWQILQRHQLLVRRQFTDNKRETIARTGRCASEEAIQGVGNRRFGILAADICMQELKYACRS
jgi:hypothetical protein